jgi:hypothetical protein
MISRVRPAGGRPWARRWFHHRRRQRRRVVSHVLSDETVRDGHLVRAFPGLIDSVSL